MWSPFLHTMAPFVLSLESI